MNKEFYLHQIGKVFKTAKHRATEYELSLHVSGELSIDVVLEQLCKDGYLLRHPGKVVKYSITDKF